MMSGSDAQQAHYAVASAVARGQMLAATSLACAQCGGRARQYHHHLGYAPEHRLAVIPLCSSCHTKAHFPRRPRSSAPERKVQAPWPAGTAGKPLRTLRILAGLSQQALGARAGVHWGTIASIEGVQKRLPRLDTRRRLANALNVDIMDVREFARDLDDDIAEGDTD